VSKLVLHNFRHTLLGRSTARLLIEQEIDNTVGDETPVLHGTLREIGNGNVVHLGEGEFSAKDLLVEFESFDAKLEREAAVFNVLAGRSVDAAGDAVRARLDVVELTDDEGQQVSRHERRRVEVNSLLGSARNLGLDLRLGSNIHVTQTGEILLGDENNGKLGLERRFVETWERSPRIGGLHLRRGEDTLCAVVSLEGGAVEAGHFVVELAGEGDFELRLAALYEG
jgi:hypothetical protein